MRRIEVRFPEHRVRALRSVSSATVWSPRRRRITIGLLLTVATGAFESLTVNTIMPAVSAELNSLRYYGLVFSAFMLTHLVGIVAGGLQADRSSPGRSYIVGTLVFSVGLIVTGTAQSMLVVAAGRALQGLGAGAVSGLTVYAVQRCYDEPVRPRMIALLSTAFVVPGMLGPSLAAGINATFGWRWVFLCLVPAMPVAALLTIPVLRLTASEEDTTNSVPQSPRLVWSLSAAVALGMVALVTGNTAIQISTAISAIAFGVFSLGKIFPSGIVWFRTGQPAAVAFLLWGSVAYYSVEAFLPLALTAVHGATIGEAGLTLSAGTVLWAVGAWLQARLVRRLGGPRLLAVASPALLAAVLSTGLLMSTTTVPMAFVSVSWALVALSMGLTSTTATLVVLNHARDGAEGRAASSTQLATLLGGALGTGLAGLHISPTAHDTAELAGDIRIVGLLAAVSAAVGVFAAIRSRTQHVRSDEHSSDIGHAEGNHSLA